MEPLQPREGCRKREPSASRRPVGHISVGFVLPIGCSRMLQVLIYQLGKACGQSLGFTICSSKQNSSSRLAQTHRHTDTQTHRHTDTQTHRHTDTQTHRHTDTQTHRHTDTQTHRHTHTHTRSRTQINEVGQENMFSYMGKPQQGGTISEPGLPLDPEQTPVSLDRANPEESSGLGCAFAVVIFESVVLDLQLPFPLRVCMLTLSMGEKQPPFKKLLYFPGGQKTRPTLCSAHWAAEPERLPPWTRRRWTRHPR